MNTPPLSLPLPSLPLIPPDMQKKLATPSLLWPQDFAGEQLSHPTGLSSGTELPDHHDLYLLMNRMATQVNLCSATAFTGKKLHTQGAQASAQLQAILESSKQIPRSSASCDSIAQLKSQATITNIPDIEPFYERHKNATNNKYRQQAAQCVKNDNILDFVESDKRPKLLYIVAERDANGALKPDCNILKSLHNVYDVKYMVVNDIEDVYREMRTYPENFLSALVIDSHGSDKSVDFDFEWNGFFPDEKALSTLKDKSTVLLLGCSTGQVKERSPLYNVRNSLKDPNKHIYLFAPRVPVHSGQIEILSQEPLYIRFKVGYVFCKLHEWIKPNSPQCCSELPKLGWGFYLDATRHITTSEQGGHHDHTSHNGTESTYRDTMFPERSEELEGEVDFPDEW